MFFYQNNGVSKQMEVLSHHRLQIHFLVVTFQFSYVSQTSEIYELGMLFQALFLQ